VLNFLQKNNSACLFFFYLFLFLFALWFRFVDVKVSLRLSQDGVFSQYRGKPLTPTPLSHIRTFLQPFQPHHIASHPTTLPVLNRVPHPHTDAAFAVHVYKEYSAKAKFKEAMNNWRLTHRKSASGSVNSAMSSRNSRRSSLRDAEETLKTLEVNGNDSRLRCGHVQNNNTKRVELGGRGSCVAFLSHSRVFSFTLSACDEEGV
jgi:hypothetical protein